MKLLGISLFGNSKRKKEAKELAEKEAKEFAEDWTDIIVGYKKRQETQKANISRMDFVTDHFKKQPSIIQTQAELRNSDPLNTFKIAKEVIEKKTQKPINIKKIAKHLDLSPDLVSSRVRALKGTLNTILNGLNVENLPDEKLMRIAQIMNEKLTRIQRFKI